MKALPEAVQIADRWHLLKNLRETVERHLSTHYKTKCPEARHML
jgi:hypothetical protein